ncbi:MAG: Hpt domain-containing protein [Bacteroidia bacterium]|nr:Hpt domain-containing protein [Bacteroidia bacterium]MCZ2248889.1 Hpt domain-containing protein [Bacteroidia bacterium]
MEPTTNHEKPNLNYLMGLMDNNKEIVIEVLNLFCSELPKDMKLMENSILEKQWKQAGKTAHKLKSSVANLGLNQLRDLFYFIEQNGYDETNIEQIQKNYENIKRSVDQLMIDIEMDIKKLSEE